MESKTPPLEIDAGTLRALAHRAASHPRKRLNLNIHKDYSASIQRFVNLIHRDSYIRPHKHVQEGLWEMFCLIQGAIDILLFDEQGRLLSRHCLRQNATRILEITASSYHCLVSHEDNGTLLEVKPGPYQPENDKIFAPWSLEEGNTNAVNYLRLLKSLKPGQLAHCI